MEPTALALALIAALGGAALTAIAGLIGAFWQSQREHTKWLRERRYEAYLDVLRSIRLIEEYWSSSRSVRDAAESLKAALEDLPDLIAPEELRPHVEPLVKAGDEFSVLHADYAPQVIDAAVAAALLGPTNVSDSMDRMILAIREGDDEAADLASGQALSAMRKAIRITNSSRG